MILSDPAGKYWLSSHIPETSADTKLKFQYQNNTDILVFFKVFSSFNKMKCNF